MPKASGVVGIVNERSGKYGPMYSIKLEGDETWYGTKGTKPSCNKGETVEFNFSINPRGYSDADLDSLVVVSGVVSSDTAGDTVAAVSNPAVQTEGRKAFDKKQAVIVYQNAGNRALELVKLANEVGVLDIPQKGTKADKYASLRIFVDMATNDFFAEAMAVYETGDVAGDSD